MGRRLAIVLLSLGAIGGFSAGFASLHHHHACAAWHHEAAAPADCTGAPR